ASAGPGFAVAWGPRSSVYMGGSTTSSSFPSKHAFQGHLAGCCDAFVARIGTDGTLVFSTYLGGAGTDAVKSAAPGAAHSALLAGITNSQDFPTEKAIQTGPGMTGCPSGTSAGCYDGFAVKITPGPGPLQQLLRGEPV